MGNQKQVFLEFTTQIVVAMIENGYISKENSSSVTDTIETVYEKISQLPVPKNYG